MNHLFSLVFSILAAAIISMEAATAHDYWKGKRFYVLFVSVAIIMYFLLELAIMLVHSKAI